MDTEPRTTTPNKEEVSALSTGEPTYRSEDGSHYQHSSGPSFSQWNRDGSRKQRGHVPRGGNGEQHETYDRQGNRGSRDRRRDVHFQDDHPPRQRDHEKETKGERQRDKRGSGRDRKSRARAAALTDESESESKSDYECRSNDTFERAKLDDDAHYQVLHMPHVNDQALAAYQEENEDAQEFAYGATQKDRNVFALTIIGLHRSKLCDQSQKNLRWHDIGRPSKHFNAIYC